MGLKMEKKYKFSTESGFFDPYKLPPIMVITSGNVRWIFNQATSVKHRKYLAAQIILGQPFNTKRA